MTDQSVLLLIFSKKIIFYVVISKIIQNKGKEQNHSPVKRAKVMPLATFE